MNCIPYGDTLEQCILKASFTVTSTLCVVAAWLRVATSLIACRGQGNVLIDGEGNARLTDFGLSQVFLPEDDSLSYLWTTSVHHGAPMWAAPERVFPKLYPEWNDSGKPRATPNGDIYSLGSVILFVCLDTICAEA